MGDEKLFRVGPGSGEWICYDALLDELWKWSSRPAGTGLPAITISKRNEEPADVETNDDGAHTPVTQEWLDEWNARPTGADVSDLIELVPVTDQPVPPTPV